MNFEELSTKGYTVIKNFLSIDDISELLTRYSLTRHRFEENGVSNKNYSILAGGQLTHGLQLKINQAID